MKDNIESYGLNLLKLCRQIVVDLSISAPIGEIIEKIEARNTLVELLNAHQEKITNSLLINELRQLRDSEHLLLQPYRDELQHVKESLNKIRQIKQYLTPESI